MRRLLICTLAVMTVSLAMSINLGCVAPSPPKAKAHPSAVSDDKTGLTILASGAQRLEVVDPLGRRMLSDARTGETIAEIPGASIEGLSSEHDNGEGADDSFTGYDLDIPEAVDGHYGVSVSADSGLSLNVAAYSDSGVFAAESIVDTTAAPKTTTYDIVLASATKSVTVRKGAARRR